MFSKRNRTFAAQTRKAASNPSLNYEAINPCCTLYR